MEPFNPSFAPKEAREPPTSKRRLAAVLALVRAIADAPSVVEAARKVFTTLGEADGFCAGVLWLAPEGEGRLQVAETWIGAGLARGPLSFVGAVPISPTPPPPKPTAQPARGEGLAGRAWASGRMTYAADVAPDDQLAREPWPDRDGVRAVLAVPVLTSPRAGAAAVPEARVAAVLELFARSARDPDPVSEDLWSVVATELGRLIRAVGLERALARAEQRLALVLAEAPLAFFALDREGRFTRGEGRASAGLAGLRDHTRGSIFTLYADVPAIATQARRALAGEGSTVAIEVPSGERVRTFETRMEPVFDAQGRVAEVIGVATDVTERRDVEAALERSEAKLVEAGRLASLGTLAAGVAHEINNPLAYVLLNLELMIREASAHGGAHGGEEAELLPRMREAREGVERVRLIVHDLKSFSRPGGDRVGPVDVHQVLDSAIEIAANEIRYRARLVRAYDEVPPALGDASRLGQVFLNLLINAAQAMPEGDAAHHEIRVATRTEAAEGDGPPVDPRGRVVVEIADTGAGIPPEHLERVFEPFFTTKPAGVGTGLGLSICRTIVRGLGGDIHVESALGRGTVVRVRLPGATTPCLDGAASGPNPRAPSEPSGAAEAETVAGAAAPRAPSSTSERRRGRVLVIDDEPALGAALARSLERSYDAIVVASGREALERLAGDRAFDVILCDLIMPELTGMDLYDEVHRMDPPLARRIVFMTGGTFTARARAFLERVERPVLEKPFDLPTLNALLRASARG